MEHGQDGIPSAISDGAEVHPSLAYVKVIDETDHIERVYALFEADGHLVGVAPTRALAFAAARQRALEPVDAH